MARLGRSSTKFERAVRMKRFLSILAFMILAATASFAQGQPPAQQQSAFGGAPRKKSRAALPTPKIQLALSAAFNRYDAPTGYYLNMPGWTASAEYTFRRWVGAQGELSGDYSNRAYVGFTSVHEALIGPQFFPVGHRKFTPWGHALVGEGYYRDSIPAFGGFPAKVNGDFAFSWEGGLGVDMHYKKRWSIRVLEFDYVSTKFYTNHPNTPDQSDYRVQVGAVYSIGQR
jgi:hypothetical protein